jgi:hypothetical protein
MEWIAQNKQKYHVLFASLGAFFFDNQPRCFEIAT